MAINSVGNTMGNEICAAGNTAYTMGQIADSYSRSLQSQIVNAQKKLQEIAADEELSAEEKMKKKQEINEEIASLNRQLRQYQAEMRKQKKSESGNGFDDMLGTKQGAGSGQAEDAGVLISLSTSKEQLAGMKKVRTELQGKLRSAKTEEERASLEEKIENLTKDITAKVEETQDCISDYRNNEKTEKENEKEDTEGDNNAREKSAEGMASVKGVEDDRPSAT